MSCWSDVPTQILCRSGTYPIMRLTTAWVSLGSSQNSDRKVRLAYEFSVSRADPKLHGSKGGVQFGAMILHAGVPRRQFKPKQWERHGYQQFSF